MHKLLALAKDRTMRHRTRQTDYRHELDGLDPIAMLVIPLAILLLSLLVVRAILAAAVV